MTQGTTRLLLGFAVAILLLTPSCTEELPEAGSLADLTPPEAGFAFASDAEDNLKINFTNTSSSAIDFEWSFGDGNTSTETEPSNTYADYGKYMVTLMSTDAAGVSSSTEIEIEVIKGPFQPIVLEPGIEGDGATGDGRDPWRASWSDGRPIFGVTGSPVTFGGAGAKLETSSARKGYQEVVVEADQNYDLVFWYTMKNDKPEQWAIMSIVGVTDNEPIESDEDAEAAIIAQVIVNDSSEPDVYVQERLKFNSGTNTKIAIFFYNDANIETRFDEFSIEVAAAGALPPTAEYSVEQSTVNYLEYAFTNSSGNASVYDWDFGDGNSSMDEHSTHVYAEAGTYTITLTASNEFGTTDSFSSEITINDPVTADFSALVDPLNEFMLMFTNESSDNAVSVEWDFGDGWSTTEENPTHTYNKVNFYTVTITATSVTGFTATKSLVFPAGLPEVENGNFDSSTSGWKISSFTGGTTSPFNGSGDGSPLNYDNSESGKSKTKGAKWTGSTAGGENASSKSRYAYQAVTLDPNTDYVLEYAYSMKDDSATDPSGGRRMVAEILDGHYSEGAVAVDPAQAPRLATTEGSALGTVVLGKAKFTIEQLSFTSNGSGEVSIWLYGVTPKDGWFDNVKIIPASATHLLLD